MHSEWLDILCSPKTREPLRLDAITSGPGGLVEQGTLSTSAGEQYPVVRCVPRFVGGEDYSESFGYEWRRWPRLQFDDQNVGKAMELNSLRKWEGIVGLTGSLEGQRIVEFGCGAGRFLDVVRRKGGMAAGIDLSLAVDAARNNFSGDPQVLIVQGDVTCPPFREGSFDGGYTIGVLHHTPNPVEGLRQLARCVKKGGWVACSVYPRNSVYAHPSLARWRKWHGRVVASWGSAPALAYSMLSAYVLWWAYRIMAHLPLANRLASYLDREWLPVAHVSDSAWRLLDTFDSITPSYASTHTREEVQGWFAEAGCSDVRQSLWGDTSFVGIKR